MCLKNKSYIFAFTFFICSLCLTSMGSAHELDYTQKENWAYFNTTTPILAEESKQNLLVIEQSITEQNNTEQISIPLIDVFFVAPTVFAGKENLHNMPIQDMLAKTNFLGATNMEKGIYDTNARFFAPYYRQAALSVYKMPLEEREAYLAKAYLDIRKAFLFYMQEENKGRPFILAGFSQGADMCIRLLKEFFEQDDYQKLLIACYAIGWRLTEDELIQYPFLKPAQKADDTGVIISFNSEARHITHSLVVPEGIKTFAINPLTWETHSNIADKSLNKGSCFTDYSGAIISEIPALTGAYIDEMRGTLKVLDVEERDYPALLDIFEEGVYHIYDYLFFYRNLQENVTTRCNAYFKAYHSK